MIVSPSFTYINDDNRALDRHQSIIISLIQNYMPDDWSLAIVGATLQVSNMLMTMPMRIPKIYLIVLLIERLT